MPEHRIARRTGLGRATVYRHFPDRTSLALAVAARYLAALKQGSAHEAAPGG
ncbi:TetR family transcriptional regulator [Saccharothrix sp.]|uniref:TetR family transcriptional regulator n=1 Tax=Saccharothrix sp. TaxID=1873460 RepID=UPI002811B480|nr:TetR family transcriptional regulator [Saccharothrix sp.]